MGRRVREGKGVCEAKALKGRKGESGNEKGREKKKKKKIQGEQS